MKQSRVWVLAALSLAGLALSGTTAFAGLFGCCFRSHCCTQITCRPYNAFTPICWGNLTCDGCCPSFGGGCGFGYQACAMPTPVYSSLCGDSGACLPTTTPAPAAAPATIAHPLPNVSMANPYFNPMAYYGYGVQPTAYHPGYYNPYQAYYNYQAAYNANLMRMYQAGYNPYLMNAMWQQTGYYPGYYGQQPR
jgi:hypothetical protein